MKTKFDELFQVNLSWNASLWEINYHSAKIRFRNHLKVIWCYPFLYYCSLNKYFVNFKYMYFKCIGYTFFHIKLLNETQVIKSNFSINLILTSGQFLIKPSD